MERWEWRSAEGSDPSAPLAQFLDAHGLGGEPAGQRQSDRSTAVVLLLGADACTSLAGLPRGRPSPAPDVPDLVAVAVRRGGKPPPAHRRAHAQAWRPTWSDAEHAAAVERVREEIARGEVYQVNVVGHRSAALTGSPLAAAAQVAAMGTRVGAGYGGVVSGDGWAVGSASPEQLVQVVGDRVTTVPVKGTLAGGPEAVAALRASSKDRAEHVMIVDLERNDLARVAQTGSVTVERLYDVQPWAQLWHAGSLVSARLEPGTTTLDVVRAVAPGGSVTGAPKRAACRVLNELEPVGRGPAMGGLGFVSPGRLDLGLSIRTVAAAGGRVHLWAGGGITWSSEAALEVAEAHAKAAPVVHALT